MPGIQGDSEARGFTYSVGDGQYTTYQNPNVEIDDYTGDPIDMDPVIDYDKKVKPTVQYPDGKPGVEI